MWVCVGNKPSQTGLCLLYQLFIKLQMFNSYYCKKYNVYSIICAFVQVFMVWTRVSLVKLLYIYSINRQVVFGDFLSGSFIILCLLLYKSLYSFLFIKFAIMYRHRTNSIWRTIFAYNITISIVIIFGADHNPFSICKINRKCFCYTALSKLQSTAPFQSPCWTFPDMILLFTSSASSPCYLAFYLVLNHPTFDQIKKRHGINYSNRFYIRLLYAVPFMLS